MSELYLVVLRDPGRHIKKTSARKRKKKHWAGQPRKSAKQETQVRAKMRLGAEGIMWRPRYKNFSRRSEDGNLLG